jgi:oxygen-dependent protoporphyrinogen oxidase
MISTIENTAPGDARTADVLICGGGISGLSLAAWLERAGVRAIVIDKNKRPGGVIGTIHKDGFLFERGPNTILDKYESFDELIGIANLENEILRAPLNEQVRHIWLRGALRPVPTGPWGFVTTPLLGLRGKLALLGEILEPYHPQEESVADFVRRRLGEDWVRNLITPMVSGIWAGDPAKLSIEHAFPIMKEMERDGGSIIRGAIRRMKRAKMDGKPRRRKNLVSFRDGLQRLPEALAARLGERYRSATAIERIEPAGDGAWRVVTSAAGRSNIENENENENGREAGAQRQVWTARELVIAAEADHAARWIEGFDSEAAAVLRSFPYNRLVVAALGIEKRQARLPEGFGFLAPRGEGVRLLGAIINSNFLPGRAPERCAALTIFIGGDLDQAAFDLDDDEIIGLLKRDLRVALGWSGVYRSLHLERWPRAIPQYDMRHGRRLAQIEEAEARHPGLHLVGNWRGGTAIADRVEFTRALAQRISKKLMTTPA